MGIEVFFSDDANQVLNKANVFLSSKPVHHNLILALLHARVAEYEPGRYWIVQHNKAIIGVVVQSPLNSRAIVTPMESEVVGIVVDAISNANVALPGIAGEAATVACFAGEWAEQHKSPVFPF